MLSFWDIGILNQTCHHILKRTHSYCSVDTIKRSCYAALRMHVAWSFSCSEQTVKMQLIIWIAHGNLRKLSILAWTHPFYMFGKIFKLLCCYVYSPIDKLTKCAYMLEKIKENHEVIWLDAHMVGWHVENVTQPCYVILLKEYISQWTLNGLQELQCRGWKFLC